MKSTVFRFGVRETIDRGQGIGTQLLACRRRGSRSLLTGITELASGCETPLHWHDCEEFAFVLEGDASVEVGDETVRLTALDGVLIPVGIPHRIVNVGASGKLRFLWTYPTVAATRTVAGGATVAMDDGGLTSEDEPGRS